MRFGVKCYFVFIPIIFRVQPKVMFKNHTRLPPEDEQFHPGTADGAGAVRGVGSTADAPSGAADASGQPKTAAAVLL